MSGKPSYTATQRIKRDLKDIMQSKDAWGISVNTVDGQLLKLKGEMKGPPDTPYEGGKYILDIEVPETYPFKPVKVQFLTKIWHPNISSVTGAICLNILKDDWRPVISMKAVLMSIQALLSAAEPDNPQDAVVARQYKRNPSMFKRTAEHWARVYAGAPGSNSAFESLIKRLVDKGVDEAGALVALSSYDWNLAKASDFIFS